MKKKMPIKLKSRIVDGWKAEENNRVGKCLVVEFTNENNGFPLFKYAPKLEDELFWINLFVELKELDEYNKKIGGRW